MTVLQLCLFVFFMLDAILLFCTNLYILFAVMVIVGLMGGASYVNVIYAIRQSTVLDSTEKELALNMLAIFNDVGVLMASLTALLLTSVIFKQND
jgi:MFS family permease